MKTVNNTNATPSESDWAENVDAFLEKLHSGLVSHAQTVRLAQEVTDDQIEELYTRGYQFFRQGHLDRAIALLSSAYSLSPTSSRYLYALAVALENAERLDEALMAYLMHSILQPADPLSYLRIGECLLQKGEQTAAEWFQQALELFDPGKDAALIDQLHVQLQALQSVK